MDWNSDGRHDLLIGDAEGKTQVYLNTNTNRDPILSTANYIMAGGVELDIGNRAAPVADDWNGDGKKDLLIGVNDGRIRIYINKGSDSEPLFDVFYFIEVSGRVFDAGQRSAPRIYDWNGDGLKDLLVGEWAGYVYFLKNVGTNYSPVFDKAEKLFLGNADFLRYPDPYGSARSRLMVLDWNNDGLDDILLGGRDGRIILYRASSKPLYSFRVFIRKIKNQLWESAAGFKKQFQNDKR